MPACHALPNDVIRHRQRDLCVHQADISPDSVRLWVREDGALPVTPLESIEFLAMEIIRRLRP